MGKREQGVYRKGTRALALLIALSVPGGPAAAAGASVRSEVRILIEYSNPEGGPGWSRQGGLSFDNLDERFLPGLSSPEKVVIRFQVRIPGTSGNPPTFADRTLEITGPRAAPLYAMLTSPAPITPVPAVSVLGRPVPGVSDRPGTSLGRVSFVTFQVSEPSFNARGPMRPSADPLVLIERFSIGNVTDREEDGQRRLRLLVDLEEGQLAVPLSRFRPTEMNAWLREVGVSRCQFGLPRGDGTIEPFVVLGLSRDGNALGFFPNDRGRDLGAERKIPLHRFPLEVLREARTDREFQSWIDETLHTSELSNFTRNRLARREMSRFNRRIDETFSSIQARHNRRVRAASQVPEIGLQPAAVRDAHDHDGYRALAATMRTHLADIPGHVPIASSAETLERIGARCDGVFMLMR